MQPEEKLAIENSANEILTNTFPLRSNPMVKEKRQITLYHDA